MEKDIKICTELEVLDVVASIKTAVEENPNNLLQQEKTSNLHHAMLNIESPAIALIYRKLWRPNRTLSISFMGAVDSTVKQKIIHYAKKWLEFINLKFEFIDTSIGDIRISTQSGGSWSYIGTDAKLIESHKPTMNFGWLYANTPDEEYSRVVLHEFGHALGAIHEHQHPGAGIPWDKPKVYAYYAKSGWSKEDVDRNIFAKYDRSQLNMSSYDAKSIMHYAVPNQLTKGDWEVGWNRGLSNLDKRFMKRVYGPQKDFSEVLDTNFVPSEFEDFSDGELVDFELLEHVASNEVFFDLEETGVLFNRLEASSSDAKNSTYNAEYRGWYGTKDTPRWCPAQSKFKGRGGTHKGGDLFVRKGTELVALVDGQIQWNPKGPNGKWGNHIWLNFKHKNKNYTIVYAHLDALVGSGNRKVKAGEVICTSGCSGNTVYCGMPNKCGGYEDHVHIELHGPKGLMDFAAAFGWNIRHADDSRCLYPKC